MSLAWGGPELVRTVKRGNLMSATPSTISASAIRSAMTPLTIAAGACSLLMLIGSFGAWVTVSIGGASESASGTTTGAYGIWTAILAVAAFALLGARVMNAVQPPARQYLGWGMLGCFAISGILGIAAWTDLQKVASSAGWAIVQGLAQFSGSSASLDPGWGLILVIIAAVAGVVISFRIARQWPAAVVDNTTLDKTETQ